MFIPQISNQKKKKEEFVPIHLYIEEYLQDDQPIIENVKEDDSECRVIVIDIF